MNSGNCTVKSAVLAVGFFSLSAFYPAVAQDTVQLTSLSWPPFTGEELPDGGANTELLRAILAESGLTLEVSFLPWQRAVSQGLDSEEFTGYFPEYFSDELGCLVSPAYDSSVVGFVERVDGGIDWTSVADLSNYTIGVVDGYVNDGGPFDAAVADGSLTVDGVVDDISNVRKVLAGRLDAAVIDQAVLEFLIETEVPEAATALQFDERILKEHSLHVCLQDTDLGHRIADAITAYTQ